MFGGAENNLELVASDVIIRDNHLNKRKERFGTNWVVKNFLEIKSGRRIKISKNLMTNNWAMAQEGTAVLFRTAIDSGNHAVVEDIEFTDNIVRSSASALNIYGGEGRGGRRLIIKNNIFEDINGKKYKGRGYFIKSTSFRNNIVFHNEYGFFGDGGFFAQKALNKYFPRLC